MKLRAKIFRKIVNVADILDVWFKQTFNINPKQRALEVAQELIPMKKLDHTIGKSLDIIRGVEDE